MRKTIVGLLTAGVVVAGFGSFAFADSGDCINESRLWMCGPHQSGVDAQSDGWGSEWLLDESNYGAMLGPVHDDGGHARAEQDWYNDSASDYGWRNTNVSTHQSPSIDGQQTSWFGVVEQWNYHDSSNYRALQTHAGADARSNDAPGAPEVRADFWQYQSSGDANGCDQYAETHVRAFDQGDDGYHPSRSCPVLVPEIPGVPQVGNPR